MRAIVDPESGGCTAEMENKVSHIDQERAQDEWVTLDMLGGPCYMNNTEHSAAMVLDMDSRPFRKLAHFGGQGRPRVQVDHEDQSHVEAD